MKKKRPGMIRILLVMGFYLLVSWSFAQNQPDSTYVGDTSILNYEAQPDSPPDETALNDAAGNSENVTAVLLPVSIDSIRSIQHDEGFYYMTYLDSMLRAAEASKRRQAQPKDDGITFWELEWVKYIFWTFAIAVVGFVLFKLFMGDGGMLMSNKTLNRIEVKTEGDIDENDLEGLMEKSISNKDYRLALRYQFLKTLKRLGEKGILQLSADKTNHQYFIELKGKLYASRFTRLSLQYEYVWFGEFDLNNEQFRALQQEHLEFLKAI